MYRSIHRVGQRLCKCKYALCSSSNEKCWERVAKTQIYRQLAKILRNRQNFALQVFDEKIAAER